MFANFGLGLDDLGTIGAFLAVVGHEDVPDCHVHYLLDVGVPKFVVAERINAGEVIQFGQQFGGALPAVDVGVLVKQQIEHGLEVFFLNAGVEQQQSAFLLAVAFVLLFEYVDVDHRAGEGLLAADHHRLALGGAGGEHVAAGGGMAVSLFELFPTVGKERAIVVEADKKNIGAPAEAIPHVEEGGFAAGKPLLAMGAVMFFLRQFDTSFSFIHHQVILRKKRIPRFTKYGKEGQIQYFMALGANGGLTSRNQKNPGTGPAQKTMIIR